jgi:hypothetical protein
VCGRALFAGFNEELKVIIALYGEAVSLFKEGAGANKKIIRFSICRRNFCGLNRLIR